jgi:Cu/Zn superoxide dismutase
MEMEMNMGDPDATPASEVAGAEVVTGEFMLLTTRPPGYDDVTGTAYMARHDSGTTVTVEVSGLEPGVEYISHVHAEACSNNGGPHYQFEVGGETVPPNEIHLLFTADEEGNGFMTAENAQTVDERAVAIVVHPVDLIDNKIACADF